MRSNTSCKNTVYNLLYAGNVQSKYLQYGKDMEPIARKKSECIIGEKIQICGLIVDPDEPYLAASPGEIFEYQVLGILFYLCFYNLIYVYNLKYIGSHIDGLIGKTVIIEIKCPYIAKDTSSAIDAINKKLVSHVVYIL